MRLQWKFLHFVLITAFLAVSSLSAQQNAMITGTILDPSGAVVPNVKVTLTDQATSQARVVTSNEAGLYSFPDVEVGKFNLTATAPGFQTLAKNDIVVNVGQSLKEDLSLRVGSEADQVTVMADSLQVQTESNELSNLISGEQLTELATNGRNITALASLGLGVSNNLPSFSGVNALTSANAISFNGTRVSHNIYLLDGGELNDRGCGGCFSSLPSTDALAEFQTLASNYGPEYGIGSGGTVLMVLKSGTNRFHGSLWEFNRNEDFDANNYFTKLAGKARPKFRLNEPGGNFGGPVWIPHIYDGRDRTFFFVNEEWRRLIQGSSPTLVTTVAANNFPTLGQPLTYTAPSNGKVPVVPNTTDPAKLALYAADGLVIGQPFPGNVIPANLIDQNAVRELNAGTFPHPNFGTSQYISSIPQVTNVREDVVRLDHKINTKLQLMAHYLHDDTTQSYFPPLWGNSTYPTVGTAMQNPSWSATVKLTQTLSPTLLNETAYLFSGNTIHLTPTGISQQPAGWTGNTFFPADNNIGHRMPEVQLGAPYGTTWSSSYFPWKNSFMGYEIRDDLSWNHGKHQFRFGASWLRDPKNQQLQANTQGTAVFNNSSFSGDSYVNFLLGDAASFTQLEYLAGKHWVNNNYSGYFNDNWHLTPRMTLNLGLRYDGLPHAYERYNQFANFDPTTYNRSLPYPLNPDGTLNPATLTTFNGKAFYLNGIHEADVSGFPRGVVKNDYKTLQPRIGFAYDVTGNGKTVVRSGVGIFFERVQGNDVYNAALNPPFAYQPSATNVYFSDPRTSATDGTTTSQVFPSTMTTLDPHYPNPGTAMFSMGVQRELVPSVVAVLQYAGSVGWHQSDDRAINTLPLTDTKNPSDPYDLRRGVATGQLKPNLYRIFPGFSGITQEENTTNFSYHSLQAGVRMESKHGVTVQLAYTYSHAIDLVSQDLASLGNPFNKEYNRGSGSLDRRHNFNVSYIYAMPFFAHGGNAFTRATLGGWTLSGITLAETGRPQAISYNGADKLGLGGGTSNRADQIARVRYPKTRLAWFDKTAFAAPLAPWEGGTNQGFGNSGKDAVILPGLLNFNMSLFKTIRFQREATSLQLRIESFNTFNHTEFNTIDAGSNDANFGQVTSTQDQRRLQLGAKLNF